MIQILGWDRHQHFKDRRPSWIKVWVDLIDDPDNAKRWYAMSDTARSLLIELWLLTAKGKGHGDGFLEADDDTVAWWTRRPLKTTVKAIDELVAGQWVTREPVDQLSLLNITSQDCTEPNTTVQDCTGPNKTLHNLTNLNESAPRVSLTLSSNSNSGSKPKGTVAQSPPSISEVIVYMTEYMKKKNAVGADPAEDFMDHFVSNGWRVSGKAPMKCWKSAARKWVRNNIEWGRLTVVADSDDDEWLYESYRRSCMDVHGEDPDWQCYIEWASDWCTEHGPRTSPSFEEFKKGSEE